MSAHAEAAVPHEHHGPPRIPADHLGHVRDLRLERITLRRVPARRAARATLIEGDQRALGREQRADAADEVGAAITGTAVKINEDGAIAAAEPIAAERRAAGRNRGS